MHLSESFIKAGAHLEAQSIEKNADHEAANEICNIAMGGERKGIAGNLPNKQKGWETSSVKEVPFP